MTDDEFLSKIYDNSQTVDDMANYLDADPGSVKAMVQDLRDYAQMDSLDNKGVNDLFTRFKNVTRSAKESYENMLADFPEAAPEMSGERRAVKNLKGVSLIFDKAKSREDKVIAIDKLMSLEHARGMMLPYGYGVGDMDRGTEFMQQALTWLRNQKVYK